MLWLQFNSRSLFRRPQLCRAQEPPPHYPKKPLPKIARPRAALEGPRDTARPQSLQPAGEGHAFRPGKQPYGPSSEQATAQAMPEHKHRVCNVNEDPMKASREAAQRTELGRAKCKEQHSTRAAAPRMASRSVSLGSLRMTLRQPRT